MVNVGQVTDVQLNLYAAKSQLSRLVEEAGQGKTVIIAKAGKPVAALGPLTSSQRTIRLGLMKGRIRIGTDFDDPLPDDELALFEKGL
ncbi:MAG TPA: hypothetical protein VFQ88_09900 [Nevskiaceae bacterium]|nr:hypothetical protein [Nevskiaceae bacterium]